MKNRWLFFILILSNYAVADIKSDVTYLAAPRLNGRMTGSAGNKEVQSWLVQKMQASRLRPSGDIAKNSFQYSFKNKYDYTASKEFEGTNIIGILYPNNTWSDEKPKVMIGAHFDHLKECRLKFGTSDTVCHGATDNAAAVAVVLSLIQTLPSMIEAPVAIAFWDAEEMGLLGSDAFLKAPSFDLASLNTYINLDIIGLNLFKGLENDHFVIGSETGGPALENLVHATLAETKEPVTYHLLSYAFGHGRSDMSSFLRHNLAISTLFFSDGDGAVYHSSSDDVSNVNFEKVASILKIISELTVRLAKLTKNELEFKKPNVYLDKGTFLQEILHFIFGNSFILKAGLPTPIFADVVEVRILIKKLLLNKETNKLGADTIAKLVELESNLGEIQIQGESNFSFIDKFNLLKSAAIFTQASKDLTFIP